MSTKDLDTKTEDATPSPEHLIKSIAEQGYSLETSLADLIDNSISASANKIEILINPDQSPFTLFLADNGHGMSEERLKRCMQFPSSSLEAQRIDSDLGRFGLGLKTASFAQTRRFTVLSRSGSSEAYSARTWDVSYLKEKQKWKIIINSPEEIAQLLNDYTELSSAYLNHFADFWPSTIVVWQGLYKFEEYLDLQDRSNSLKNQISETTTEYLSLVFHRFMEREIDPLFIRVNNALIKPFNPFPTAISDVRLIESRQRVFKSDVIKLEGYVLPVRSIEESKEANNVWTTKSRGLMDMEGMYIYRSDRVILFGGWNGIIRKSPRLQLARLKVEVGNKVDNLLHLNVAKSQITIPYDLRFGFLKYISELKGEAEKEYFNRGIRKISSKEADTIAQLFQRIASNKGTLLEVNSEFPLVKVLESKIDAESRKILKVLIRMINTTVNKIRHVHDDYSYVDNGLSSSGDADALQATISQLLTSGTSKQNIKETILPALGYRIDTIPDNINEMLN
ncbi:MAG: ATP-binding protein [Arcticibacter sp.]